MDAGWQGRSKIEEALTRHYKLVAGFVIIAQQILPAAHVAEKQKDVLVIANRPKVGTGAVIADQAELIILHKGMQIFPVG